LEKNHNPLLRIAHRRWSLEHKKSVRLSGTSGQIFHLEKGTNYKHACPQLLDYFQLCPFAPPCSDDILELSEHVPLSPLLGNIDLTRCIVGGCGAVFFLLDF